MNGRFVAPALRLIERLSAEQRRGLSEDPVAVLGDLGILVVAADPGNTLEKCSCDGWYVPADYAPGLRPTIVYVRTPHSRRESFTLLHELCHHLVRLDLALLSEIADADGDGDEMEERICDAFAGRVLIPDEVVRAVLKGGRPRASHLPALFDACNGSLEACAVRLAEHLRCDGYVALLERATHTLRFASTSPEGAYAWGRGSKLPSGHPVWRAGESRAYNGEGAVVWASGYQKPMWLDAVGNGAVVCAVFSAERYWGGTGLSILSDAPSTKSMPMLVGGTCAHCGAGTYGLRACDKCGDVKCRKCGRCGCGAPKPAMRTCTKCYMMKARSQFRAGSSECRECSGT